MDLPHEIPNGLRVGPTPSGGDFGDMHQPPGVEPTGRAATIFLRIN